MEEVKYNAMQKLKREMFAMRNGVVADALRKGGCPFKVIFGVNLPQLSQIAAGFGPSLQLALQAWADSSTRESMLIAPMLMPPEEFTKELALQWIAQAPSPEVVDVLCLKLLRHAAYALPLAQELLCRQGLMERYAGLRLMCNLAPSHPRLAAAVGQAFISSAQGILRQPAAVLASYADE